MYNQPIPSNQIYYLKNRKTITAFTSMLTAAPIEHYAQILAEGEIVGNKIFHRIIKENPNEKLLSSRF